MTQGRTEIAESTVRQLLDSQFPHYAVLPLRRVSPGGWDHRTFRLGEDLAVRLPSAAHYAPQIAREAAAFAALAGHLPVAIPERVGQGAPGAGYPHVWAINRWVPGTPAAAVPLAQDFIAQCGRFLNELHRLETEQALPAGTANFHRGGALLSYAGQVELAFDRLGDDPLRGPLEQCWQQALASSHTGPACWVHGDFFPWNLLADSAGNLCGVIDWGLAATGDPACDYALGWTCLGPAQRAQLREAAAVDAQTWQRARGWSLWKALTLATGVNGGTPEDIAASRTVLARIAADTA